jgi:CheY-like chemotaxis protein
MNGQKPILLVEDDNIDAFTVERALKDLKIVNQLVRKFNGEEALEYLRDNKNIKPCIILLDLNMPRVNGIEFLKIIKEDKELKKIPVVMLTTSKENQDKLDSYKYGVAGYMVKTVDYEEFVEVINTINQYWSLTDYAAQKTETGAEDEKLEADFTC